MATARRKLAAVPTTVEAIVREWVKARHARDKAETRERQLRPFLEEAMIERFEKDEEGRRKGEIAGYVLTMTPQEREFFDLAGAKKKIDGRTLAPYISVTPFFVIRVK